ITDAVVSRRKPTLNSGRIEGSLRGFSGDNFAVAGQFQLTGDMFTAGTPTINVQNGATYGGVVSDGGSTSPSGYTVTLQTGVSMPGRIHRQADPLQLPTDIPTSVPAASGTRSVTISSAADLSSIGDWATVRDITVNAAGLTIDVPPGNYRKLSIGSTSQLNFSAGTYNFSDTITMNNGGKIQATSKVIITVANALNINYGFITLGANTLPGDVRLNLVTTAGCSLNGSSQFSALVRAPNTTLHLNGTSQIRGQVIANYVDFNGCRVIGDVSTTPPPDTTSPI